MNSLREESGAIPATWSMTVLLEYFALSRGCLTTDYSVEYLVLASSMVHSKC